MIYLVRHGLDDESFIGGWSNASLTDEGVKQIKETADYIKSADLPFENIYSSDIKRAYESAMIIKEETSFESDIIRTSILRELDKGELNGLDRNEARLLYEDYISVDDINIVYPNGESMRQFYERIKRDLDRILALDNSVLVTHRGVINMIYFILNDISLSMDKERFGVTHGSVHELDVSKRTIRKIY